jgi:hypothetical protein
MPETARQQKITFGEMRASGVRGVLIYCSDYKCSHSTAISADRWPDDLRSKALAEVRHRATREGWRYRCKLCGAWIKDRDLGEVLAHEGPLPHRSENHKR